MKREYDDDDDSDDDYGPKQIIRDEKDDSDKLINDNVNTIMNSTINKNKKPKKLLPFEAVYIENLPLCDTYEYSYMHRDIITHIVVSKCTEFIITGSNDGHIKFWKKMPLSIEFVKHFHAHLGPIKGFNLSPDGLKLASTSAVDKMIKFFDVRSFDMTNMISVSFVPNVIIWLSNKSKLYDRVAVADNDVGTIRIFKDSSIKDPMNELNIHTYPVTSMVFNMNCDTIISCDSKGIIEYWNIETLQLPVDSINFESKIDTDLFDCAKCKTRPLNISITSNGTIFAVMSTDKIIRIYDFITGKIKKKYDESMSTISNDLMISFGFDNLEISKRKAIEIELERTNDNLSYCNCVFDETGNFLIYATLIGIKILNLTTNKVIKVLGSRESCDRFTTIALYQGIPKIDSQFLLSKKSSKDKAKTVSEDLNAVNVPDPTIYVSSFKQRRFYCFSNRKNDELLEPRDVLNEKPLAGDQVVNKENKKILGKEAIIRTSLGDIKIKLFSSECPKAVENFTSHSRNGYYKGVIFHRVIKGFMIQTGDPKGDGTGGESIWSEEFEDEFNKSLKHDRPYTVSMANCGPNTNGSQFFITTVPCSWLDGKHTIFGRVVTGYDVVTKIEGLQVNKLDKPLEDVKILDIDIL